MPSSRLAAALLLASGLLACADQVRVPERKPGVPLTATWGGGIDGGHWIDCHRLAGEPARFECSTYNDYTGTLYSTGIYRPTIDPSHFALVPASYDAQGMIAINDSAQLLAEGLVTFPFDSIHGTRQEFRAGEAVGQDVEY